MTTDSRKRWWRSAAAVALGGAALTCGWHQFGRATAPPVAPAVPIAHPSAAPPGAESAAGNWGAVPAPDLPPVTPAGARLPLPAVPVPPPDLQLPPASGALEPASGPRAPDAGLVPADRNELPKLPALPTLPAPPALPPVPKPLDLGPAVPPLAPTAEPPKAPPVAPVAPPTLPLQPLDPAQSAPAAKPDSGLNGEKTGNTLKPTVPPAPAAPREVPGSTVERAKPPAGHFGPSEKYVFPLPGTGPAPADAPPQPSIDTMLTTTRTAVALLGGALLAAESAKALPVVPALPPVAPAVPVRAADEKADVEKLKTDLAAANKRIEALEKQVKGLSELLTGKKDDLGLPVPSDPGAVARIKELQDTIDRLTKELNAMKQQTALKPNVTGPEAKPKGVVRVVNDYPVEISMVVNEKSYRVAPNTKLDVEVPAGEFTYQLLQAGVAATRSVIKDKETVTLRIK